MRSTRPSAVRSCGPCARPSGSAPAIPPSTVSSRGAESARPHWCCAGNASGFGRTHRRSRRGRLRPRRDRAVRVHLLPLVGGARLVGQLKPSPGGRPPTRQPASMTGCRVTAVPGSSGRASWDDPFVRRPADRSDSLEVAVVVQHDEVRRQRGSRSDQVWIGTRWWPKRDVEQLARFVLAGIGPPREA